ncbi:MAG: ATP synthase F1 subunit gamma [Clostridia bacterium]|nr:ATP synthase F1 subunit gamma [Clostridia bacterium]
MAGASMNDIKARIKSVESTMQITKAMELVATSKLRRAKEKAERSRPFLEILGDAIKNIENSNEIADTVWCEKRDTGRTLYIVIAGDRGLAGGYNANIFRLTARLSDGQDVIYLPIGKKALEYYRHRKCEILTDEAATVAAVGVGDAQRLGKDICEAFISGKINKAIIVYTKFQSMITQLPVHEELLPLERPDDKKAETDPIIEEDPEELLAKIVPEYIGGIIYSAVCESLASESGARRSAMNAANKNASEMIDTLMLKYNRARQAVITQEITEIVSGAEAL